MPSFDIISELDNVELRNAVENANRELATRFDFRSVDANFELVDDNVKLVAEGDFQLKQMRDILRVHLAKRGVDANSMDSQEPDITGKKWQQTLAFRQGIDSTVGKKIIKLIKEKKIKVQAAINGDKVRVTGKKRDDLQEVMALVRQAELGQVFQFNNFRD